MNTIVRPVNDEQVLWDPKLDGPFFKDFKENFQKDIDRPKEDLDNTIKSTIEILSKSIDPFKSRQEQIKSSSTGLVIGDVQSGKTSSMQALCHLAHDNKYKIIVILSGNVGSLARQTAIRFEDLSPVWGWEFIRNDDEVSLDDNALSKCKAALETWDETYEPDDRKTLVITSLKLYNRINQLTEIFEDLSAYTNLENCPVLVIDDEADHYSLNSTAAIRAQRSAIKRDISDGRIPRQRRADYTIIQEGETVEKISERENIDLELIYRWNGQDQTSNWTPSVGEVILLEEVRSTTNKSVLSLRESLPFHSYIGYTATPYANLLQDTIDELDPAFGVILEPGVNYNGSEFFFLDKENRNNLIYNIDDIEDEFDAKNDGEEDLLSIHGMDYSLELALRFFVIQNAICYTKNKHKDRKFKLSMMVHTHRTREDHRNVVDQIRNQISEWNEVFSSEKSNDPIPHLKNEIESFKEVYTKMKKRNEIEDMQEFDRDFRFKGICRALNEISRNIIEFNARRGRIPEIKWKDPAVMTRILIGGDGLDRGYTIHGLTITYISRNRAGQVDTQQQRARFFGYRKDTVNMTKIFLPTTLVASYRDNARLESQFKTHLKKHLNNKKLIKDWPRTFRSEQRLTSNTKQRRSLITIPRATPVRTYRDHRNEEFIIEHNKIIFEKLFNLAKHNGKRFEELKPGRDEAWLKNNHSKIIVDIKLSEVIDEYLSDGKIQFGDSNTLRVTIDSMQDFMLKNGDLLCPIVVVDPNTTKKRTLKSRFDEIPIDSGGGGAEQTKDRPSYNKFHYEYLINEKLKNVLSSRVPKRICTLQAFSFEKIYLKNKNDSNNSSILLYENYPQFRFISSKDTTATWQIEN